MQKTCPATSHHPSHNESESNEKTSLPPSLSSGLTRFLVNAALFLTVFCASTFCHARGLEMEWERFGSNREAMWMSPLGLQMNEFQSPRNPVGLINGATVSQVAASLTSSQVTRGASEAGGYAGLPLLIGMACWLRFRQLSRLSRRLHADGLK